MLTGTNNQKATILSDPQSVTCDLQQQGREHVASLRECLVVMTQCSHCNRSVREARIQGVASVARYGSESLRKDQGVVAYYDRECRVAANLNTSAYANHRVARESGILRREYIPSPSQTCANPAASPAKCLARAGCFLGLLRRSQSQFPLQSCAQHSAR
jgi:hypothetical protein